MRCITFKLDGDLAGVAHLSRPVGLSISADVTRVIRNSTGPQSVVSSEPMLSRFAPQHRVQNTDAAVPRVASRLGPPVGPSVISQPGDFVAGKCGGRSASYLHRMFGVQKRRRLMMRIEPKPVADNAIDTRHLGEVACYASNGLQRSSHAPIDLRSLGASTRSRSRHAARHPRIPYPASAARNVPSVQACVRRCLWLRPSDRNDIEFPQRSGHALGLEQPKPVYTKGGSKLALG